MSRMCLDVCMCVCVYTVYECLVLKCVMVCALNVLLSQIY